MANTRPKLFDAPFFPTMMKAMSVAHVALFRLTRGRVGSKYRFGWTDRVIPVVICEPSE
jgi:hypothetical protein